MAKAKDSSSDPAGSPASVKVREAAEMEKPVRRTFPGPRGAEAKLRVAVERPAYAELVAHAKGSLEAEVCGVLAGQVCEDDEGLFVDVSAIIRGTAASQASTHVTFTQETWNSIYKTLERDFPKLKIVGWYHTHPGFGVEFSEMDLFIQRNFFSGPTHLALVTDPLNGDVAICMNTAEGIQYLERFWVDSREQQCRMPKRTTPGKSGSAPADTATAVSAEQLRTLEERLSQLVQSLDDMRGFHHRFMLTCGFLFCLTLIAGIGFTIYKQMTSRLQPPEINSFVPVPVKVGDKDVLLGVGVVTWNVPPELNSVFLQAELLKRQAEEKARAKGEANNTNSPATNAAPNK